MWAVGATVVVVLVGAIIVVALMAFRASRDPVVIGETPAAQKTAGFLLAYLQQTDDNEIAQVSCEAPRAGGAWYRCTAQTEAGGLVCDVDDYGDREVDACDRASHFRESERHTASLVTDALGAINNGYSPSGYALSALFASASLQRRLNDCA